MDRAPIHWSVLKHIARSPAHYRQAASVPFEPSASMRLGTIVHALVLGATWPIAVFDGASRRGKAWTEWRDAELATHPRATLALQSEMDAAQRMADAVRACPDAMLALDGAHEVDLEWSIAGRPCAGRLDALGPHTLCDLKTARDASPMRFPWEARRMEYAAQLGWYYDGVIAAGLPAPSKASIVAVESAAPYCVVVYDLTDALLDMGRRRARGLLERLLTCEASDEWPGYAQEPIVLDIMEQDGDAPVLDFGDDEEGAT